MRPDQRVKTAITWLAFYGAAAGTLLALFSSVNWFAELFSHFRLYYLLAQALLLLTFLYSRRLSLMAITVLLALPNLWYVGPYLSPLVSAGSASSFDDPAGSVASINLNYRNHEHARALEYVRNTRPDVVVWLEYTPRWDSALEALHDEYPFRVIRPQNGPFGMAIYSRTPLSAVRDLPLARDGSANLAAEVELAGRRYSLFGLHLQPPVSGGQAAIRAAQLTELAGLLSEATQPVMAVGDLNLTPFSPWFHRLLDGAGLRDARRRQGLHVTWPTGSVPLWIPIDHCLTDASAGVTDVRTGPDIGSDHYPLEVSLGR